MSGGVIVGIGSELGADRIGLDIAAALESDSTVRGLNCAIHRCLAPARVLPSVLPGAAWALLIDAVRSGGEPGTVLRLSLDELANDQDRASSHGIGVSATLALLKALGEVPESTVIVAVEVGAETTTVPAAWIEDGRKAALAAIEQLAGMETSCAGNQTTRSRYTCSDAGTDPDR